jgi:predicted N-acetyltransferase YhbS
MLTSHRRLLTYQGMSIQLRQPTAADADAVARLVFDAFTTFHDRHQMPRDFPALDAAIGLTQAWIHHPQVWGVLAERDGKIIGCNFLEERGEAKGVGPVCVDPNEQGSGIGRKVMLAVMERARAINAKSVRLVQEPYNTRSLPLYASVGFDVKEPLAVMIGTPTGKPSRDTNVRPMAEADLPACAALCRSIHQIDRTGELRDAIQHFQPFVLERGGAIRAYASAPNFFLMNHAVAETPADMQNLLLGVATATGRPIGLQVPVRNAEFFRWCLSQKLQMSKPTTLMTVGEYHEPPKGAWWVPSILY